MGAAVIQHQDVSYDNIRLPCDNKITIAFLDHVSDAALGQAIDIEATVFDG